MTRGCGYRHIGPEMYLKHLGFFCFKFSDNLLQERYGMNDSTTEKWQGILVQVEDVVFEESPSSVLVEAVREYESQHGSLRQECDFGLKALSLIGNWIIGKEPVF